MRRSEEIYRRIRHQRFALLPFFIGLLVCAGMAVSLIIQLRDIRCSDRLPGMMQITAGQAEITKELTDYLEGDAAVIAIWPQLQLEAELQSGLYGYNGVITGVDPAVIQMMAAEELPVYKKTVSPVLYMNEAFFETVTGTGGTRLTSSEKEVLKERMTGQELILNYGEEPSVRVRAGGVLPADSAEAEVYMDISHMKALLLEAGDHETEQTLVIRLARRITASELEETLAEAGFEVQYSYRDILEFNQLQREMLQRRGRLLGALMLSIMMTGYYIIKP